MEKSLILATLCVGFELLHTVGSFPVDISSVGEGEINPLWLRNYVLSGLGFFIVVVVILFGCICCRNGKGFKEFSNSSGNLTVTRLDGLVNPTLNSELTIFPPLGANSNEICRFEPLPEIKYQAQNIRPAAFSYTEQEISSQDWFVDPHKNFPRNQLKYVQEYGRGWFGRVVEGEAQNITNEEKVTKVMVKILHEDATPTDHMYFLHEVKFYRDLKHPNILCLLGQCLETEPFLILLEHYPNGDLKSFLSQNLASAQALVEQGVTLKMCSNITSGLQYMHEKKFIHTDLAARNCLVSPDLTVKIGDYGNSIEIFRSDYYCAGSVALPVRWCAPETLKCTDITIETREVTPPANIWSLGVVFWEICEFCKLPYSELNDDQVIVQVLGEKNYFLKKPNMFCLHKDELYHLMRLCWKPPLQRPTASQIDMILNNLISSGKMNPNIVEIDSKRISQDFEQRWQNLKPNSIPKKDNAIEIGDSTSVECSIMPLKLKNAKVADSSFVDSPLGTFLTTKTSVPEAPRVCLTLDKESAQKMKGKSLQEASECSGENIIQSLNNAPEEAKNSVGKVEFDCSTEFKAVDAVDKFNEKEPEVDSWLKGVEINNEEDESFVRKISEAIRDLDATLALEKTSSSEENSGKSSRQNSPGKDTKESNEFTVDFKLGQDTSSFRNFTQKTFELSSLQNTEQPQSLTFTDANTEKSKELNENYGPESLIMPFVDINKCKSDVLDESLKENDSLLCGQSRHSSDTDDEIWRKRIERGEISEKVKEKSKSIANLMILTHIDSDDSDIDFDKPPDRCLHRSSFHRRSGSFAKSSLSSNNFGSENDLTYAVLEENFKESLKKLSNDHREHGCFDSLGVILPSTANRENVWENLFKSPESGEATLSNVNTSEESKPDIENYPQAVVPEELKQNTQTGNNFLANAASENLDSNAPEKEKEDQHSASSIEHTGGKEFSPETSSCDSKMFINNFSSPPENSSHSTTAAASDILVTKSAAEGLLLSNGYNSIKFEECKAFVANTAEKNIACEESSSGFTPSGNDFEIEENIKNDVSLNLKLEFNESPTAVDSIAAEKLSEKSFGNSLVPQITITEEPEDPLSEKEEEIFVMGLPVVKPLKFILKDTEEDETKTVNNSEAMHFNNKLLKNNENEFKNCDDGTSVIVGACEDFTMDYFKGLKTTSEDLSAGNIVQIIRYFRNGEENLDVWDKHLEKAFTQQLDNTNFDDISFRSFCLDSSNYQEVKQEILGDDFVTPKCSTGCIINFIESERLHTEKVEEPIHINRFTNLSVMADEEYEHFKLRTPDDERSSDSGFRDKGSLSESVEDACEGKYNLEDIEAELEEAFVKGVFTNCENDKEKDSKTDSKNCNNFEYEETKFYEDENKNEEDFSDIDGEIEFWQNKDGSDYYPEISEFSPTCSQGWYLHPPEENMLTYNRNINEDLVNALRNELQENLPVQTRSFDEFNDFYESDTEGTGRDLTIQYISDYSLPLSPILEEQDLSEDVLKKNSKNSFLEGSGSNKLKKSMVKLIESAKAIDTNTFMQYLDYMVENEGRDLYELDKAEDELKQASSPVLYLQPQNNIPEEEESSEMYFPSRNADLDMNGEQNYLHADNKDDILVINTNTNEAILLERGKPRSRRAFDCTEEQKDDYLEVDTSENDGLVFTPEMLSPDRERSLSELSRSSNGTRTGDALSEITLSSPDLVPDCFSNILQETTSQNDFSEAKENENFLDYEKNDFPDALKNSFSDSKDSQLPEMNKAFPDCNLDVNDIYEMSTSFMGNDDEDEDDDDDDNTFSNSAKLKQKQTEDEQKIELRHVENDGSNIVDWQSESSGEEELSSSSEEFIWKDGSTESKIKASHAGDFVTENTLYEKAESVPNGGEVTLSELKCSKENTNDGISEADENEDDDNESSTGSSASFTDFVPSAWNSQATPGRSALKNPDNKTDKQQKNVWFKKQKYHCVYEYPREPSDSEDADCSPFKQSNFDKNLPEAPVKHFNYGVNTVELPNKHFPYGISKVIDLSSYTDWDVVEREDGDLSLTDTDSDNGSGKGDTTSSKKTDFSFYNLSPFDYDFSTTDMSEPETQFLVSSSSRPFQAGNSSPGLSVASKITRNDVVSSKDFVTPDSGIEDSMIVTPSDKVGSTRKNLYTNAKNLTYSNTGIMNILDKLNFGLASEPKENNIKDVDFELFEDKTKNGFSSSNASLSLPSNGLGTLKHEKGRLKLDLPQNHNAELGAVINARKE